MDPFIGQIQMFGFNFAPQGWAFCNGQLLSIAQNTALFSLLGTMYGGDGITNFALPNLQGRFPMHFGQGSQLPNHTIGETAGSNTVSLTSSNLPPHNHSLLVAEEGNSDSPINTYIAGDGGMGFSTSANNVMAPNAIGGPQGSQPFSVQNPYLCVNFCIALYGIFPPRN